MMKGDINTYQMVKTLSRLMQYFLLFGADEVLILPQNGYFVSLYKNDAYDLFYICMTIADLDTYQMAKTALKLKRFFQLIGKKLSSFGPKSNRDQKLDGPSSL